MGLVGRGQGHAAGSVGFAAARRFPSPREWWLVARDPSGEVVGFVIPAHHHTDPIVAYVGVVPEQRGHGHARDLVAEATHRLCAHGHDQIVASTDGANPPMVAAFKQAGYPIERHKIDLVPKDDRDVDDGDRAPDPCQAETHGRRRSSDVS